MLNPGKGAYWRLFLFLAYIFAAPAQAEKTCHAGQIDEIASISYVHDGDTVHLEDGRKLRLIGINAPELARDNTPAQAFAVQARDVLKAAVNSSNNRIGLVYGAERHDRYRRTLAHLFTPDGENLQARLLLHGMATAIAHPPNTAYSECYLRQEHSARCQGAGIWSQPGTAIVQAVDLTAADTGYQLVSGRVDHVSESGKGVWIFMSELMLHIRIENLADFDRAELLSLSGKALTARGWISTRNRKQAKKKSHVRRTVRYYMQIRHPSAIEINPPDDSKC